MAVFRRAGITPWLPVNPDFTRGVNVADQSRNPDSLLTFYQKVLAIRKNSRALSLGDFQLLNRKPKDVLFYKREYDNEVVSVLLNMSSEPQSVEFKPDVNIQRILIPMSYRSKKEK